MPFCANEILGLATTTWGNIGSPPGTSVGYISGWYTASGNLSKLNNALDTNYYLTGDGPCIVDLDSDAMSVYEAIYSVQYLNTAQMSLLTSLACGNTANSWTNLREGDSSVTRANPVDFLRAYNQSVAQANERLDLAIAKWRLARTIPATVDAEALASYPTP